MRTLVITCFRDSVYNLCLSLPVGHLKHPNRVPMVGLAGERPFPVGARSPDIRPVEQLLGESSRVSGGKPHSKLSDQ